MQKVLIIRFSSIGDIVLTSPLLRAIKTQKPATKIHYITKKQYAPLLNHNPHVDKLFLLDKSLKKTIKLLKKESYDLVIDLHKNLRSQRIRLALKKPGFSFNKLNKEKWLMVQFKKNHLPDKHLVDRYFDASGKWNIKNDLKGLEYFNGCENKIGLSEFQNIYREKYAAVVLAGTYYTKKIPIEKLKEIIPKLQLPVYLLGASTELDIAKELSNAFPDKIINAVSITNINQSAEIIRMSQYVITGDTGLMHIAAAYSKRIYSIWGNTIPAFGMYPYMPQAEHLNHILEVKGLACRPCSKLGYPNCPKQHFDCMMKQDFSIITDLKTDT